MKGKNDSMRKIILACCAGMSTGMLVDKMKKYAQETGYECEVSAHPLTELETIKEGANIILLGPQVRFNLPKVKESCPGIVVEAIDMMAYGRMDGKAVIEHVREVLGDK